MGHLVYRFDGHTLNPASRELRHDGELVALPPKSFDCLVYLIENRERAVGRDELISAVWGRVDASDAVVSQTLLRARRAIGDTGAGQSVIRTVSRFGYQWVAAVESMPLAREPLPEEPGVDAGEQDRPAAAESSEPHASGTAVVMPAATDASADSNPADSKRSRTARPRHHGLFSALAVAALILVVLLVFTVWRQRAPSPAASDGDLVVVLPVKVEAGGTEDAWIRLGAMDYIASLLRHNGRLTVLPSEQTLHLIGEQGISPGVIDRLRATTRAHWVLQPEAAAVRQGWRVRIHLIAPNGVYDIEASGGTPLEAAAAASSALLQRIGRDIRSAQAPTALTQRLQQIDAELLTGQLDAARNLIQAAPAAQRQDPQLQVREGQLEFRAGHLAAAAALFDRIVQAPATLPIETSSQALMGLGAVALRKRDFVEAERRYDQAAKMLEADTRDAADPELLGNAYNGRGVSRDELGRTDEAIADLGLARIAMQRAGNEVEAASVGGNIGTLETRRGNATQAVQEFNLSIATFERFDVRDSLVVMLLAKASAELELLQPATALADSDRAMQLGRKLENPQLRAFMDSTRAEVLLGNGRLREAGALLGQNDRTPATLRLRLRLLLELGHFKDARLLAETLLHEPGNDDAASVLLGVQAGIDSRDLALARQWLQSQPDANNANEKSGIELARALLAAASDPATADSHYDAAVKLATQWPAPDDDVRAGAAMVMHLVARHQLDRASEVMGRLSPYADNDYRAARASLALYQAMGDRRLQANAEAQVRRLAGERDPALPVVY